MTIVAVCCILLGPLAGWLCHSFRVDRELRRRTARELRALSTRLETARRAAAFDGGSVGAAAGLVAWMKNHAAQLLAKAGRQLATARSLLPDKPQEAARVRRELELSMASLDILADFSRRYLEPMAALQRQGADQAFHEVDSWQRRLRQRVDRHCRSFDLIDESRHLELLARYVEKELADAGQADAAVLLRRLTAQLRTLNEVEARLYAKVDDLRSAST